MPNSQLKRGSWLVTLALAGGGLAYLFCSFLPNARAIHALREEIRSRHAYAAQMPALTAATAALKKQLDQTRSYASENRRELPDTARLPEVGSRMTRQADLAGAQTTHFEPQPPKDLASLRMVPVAFDARGSYAQICQMLAGLETLPERIWVEELRIEPARESGKDEECSLKLIVFTANSEISD
jgi:Tfp pilus assembly protein PilO